VWLVTVFVMGMLIGQAFDGITGFWQIVPLVGVWGTSIGVAALAFRHSLRRSNEMLRRQRFLSGLCPICGSILSGTPKDEQDYDLRFCRRCG